MPSRSKIALLPDGIRRALDKRLIQQRFGGITETAAWLRGKGHVIGKSAIGEHALRLKRRLQLAELVAAPGGAAMALVTLRVQCAAVAAAEGAGDRLFERAEEVLAWALDPAR